jgi:hypothetical protein
MMDGDDWGATCMSLTKSSRSGAVVSAIMVAGFILFPMTAGQADKRRPPCPTDGETVALSEVVEGVNVKPCNLVGVILRTTRVGVEIPAPGRFVAGFADGPWGSARLEVDVSAEGALRYEVAEKSTRVSSNWIDRRSTSNRQLRRARNDDRIRSALAPCNNDSYAVFNPPDGSKIKRQEWHYRFNIATVPHGLNWVIVSQSILDGYARMFTGVNQCNLDGRTEDPTRLEFDGNTALRS